jgi:hypothetical protein
MHKICYLLRDRPAILLTWPIVIPLIHLFTKALLEIVAIGKLFLTMLRFTAIKSPFEGLFWLALRFVMR